MKNLDYFLNFEKEYKASHTPIMEYVPGIGFEYPYEALDFLRLGRMTQLAATAKVKAGEGGLNDVEWLMLLCFYSDLSIYFRDEIYLEGKPEFVSHLQEVLDSVVKKAPIYKGAKVWRFIRSHDKIDIKIGDIVCPRGTLTCTKDDWKQSNDAYEISLLPPEETRAHALYELHNHGLEYQVNFESGTKFQVIRIEGDEYKRIHLQELS